MTLGDFNGDGKLDVVAIGGNPSGVGWNLNGFFLAMATGHFEAARTFSSQIRPSGRPRFYRRFQPGR